MPSNPNDQDENQPLIRRESEDIENEVDGNETDLNMTSMHAQWGSTDLVSGRMSPSDESRESLSTMSRGELEMAVFTLQEETSGYEGVCE